MPDVTVVDNEAEQRFEADLDEGLARLAYRAEGDRLVLVHTEVPDALEGRGIGGRLVAASVERAERDGLTVVPVCPFAGRWLRRHPEVADRVAVAWPDAG